MRVGGNRSSDAVNALAALYPALLRASRIYLDRYQLDPQQAEDLVQEAAARWFASGPQFKAAGQMYTWFATCMRRIAYHEAVRSNDVLDQDPLPLD